MAFKDQVDDRVTVVRKAIQCALDIQNELNNKKIMSNVTNLSVKVREPMLKSFRLELAMVNVHCST